LKGVVSEPSSLKESQAKILVAVHAYTSVIGNLGVAIGYSNNPRRSRLRLTFLRPELNRSRSLWTSCRLELNKCRFRLIITPLVGSVVLGLPRLEIKEYATEERFDDWLSASASANANQKSKYLRLQRFTPPAWIFGNASFDDWLKRKERQCSILWLSGTTRFGKSVLASYLTDALGDKYPESPCDNFSAKTTHFYKKPTKLFAQSFIRLEINLYGFGSLLRKSGQRYFDCRSHCTNQCPIHQSTRPGTLSLSGGDTIPDSRWPQPKLRFKGFKPVRHFRIAPTSGKLIRHRQSSRILVLLTSQPKLAISTSLKLSANRNLSQHTLYII